MAVDTIGNFLLSHDMTVYLAIFDRVAHTIGGKLFSDIAAYIDDCYVHAHTHSREIQHHQVAFILRTHGKEEWDLANALWPPPVWTRFSAN